MGWLAGREASALCALFLLRERIQGAAHKRQKTTGLPRRRAPIGQRFPRRTRPRARDSRCVSCLQARLAEDGGEATAEFLAQRDLSLCSPRWPRALPCSCRGQPFSSHKQASAAGGDGLAPVGQQKQGIVPSRDAAGHVVRILASSSPFEKSIKTANCSDAWCRCSRRSWRSPRLLQLTTSAVRHLARASAAQSPRKARSTVGPQPLPEHVVLSEGVAPVVAANRSVAVSIPRGRAREQSDLAVTDGGEVLARSVRGTGRSCRCFQACAALTLRSS